MLFVQSVYGFIHETMEVTGPQTVLTMKLTTFVMDSDIESRVSSHRLFFMPKKWLRMSFKTWTNVKPRKGSRITYLNSLPVDTRQSLLSLSCLPPHASLHVIRFYFPVILVGPYLPRFPRIHGINQRNHFPGSLDGMQSLTWTSSFSWS